MSVEGVALPVTPAPVRSEALESQSSTDAREAALQVADVLWTLPGIHRAGHQLGARELTSLARDLLAVMQRCESAVIDLVANAMERGVIDRSTAGSAARWISRLAAGEALETVLGETAPANGSGPLVPVDEVIEAPDEGEADRPPTPGIEPAHAARIAKVATACGQARNSLLANALATGRVGLPAARTALIEVDKVMPLLPSATREEVFGHFLALEPGASGRAIRELARRIIATYADEDSLREADERLDAVESVTWADLPNGMSRLIADLAPAHAALIRHALDALASPAPGNECCEDIFHRHAGESTGAPDERTPGKRRADALMLLIGRAADLIDADRNVPTSGPARLVITVGFQELVGALQGFGVTTAGTALDAHHVRQLACDADIFPMVLGSESQPLDVGRDKRLVTPGQRSAVIQRDRHCTFPGCDRPPTWCQVHHVIPWHAGGPTSLDNSALLCPRHHTIVHRDGYAATMTDSGVAWDLKPGRMLGRSGAA